MAGELPPGALTCVPVRVHVRARACVCASHMLSGVCTCVQWAVCACSVFTESQFLVVSEAASEGTLAEGSVQWVYLCHSLWLAWVSGVRVPPFFLCHCFSACGFVCRCICICSPICGIVCSKHPHTWLCACLSVFLYVCPRH